MALASQTAQPSRVRGSRVVERGDDQHGQRGIGPRQGRSTAARLWRTRQKITEGVGGRPGRNGGCHSAGASNTGSGALSLEGEPVQDLGRRRHRKHRARYRQCLQRETTHFHLPDGRHPGIAAFLMAASDGRRRRWASFPKTCEVVSMAPRRLRKPQDCDQAIKA